jgi:hypothetical protein
MAAGLFRWYERDWDADHARRRLDELEERGWSPLNTATGRITYIQSEGPDIGDAVVTDRAGLRHRTALVDQDNVTFQLWSQGRDEILVHIRRVQADLYSSDFYLSGMTEDERNDVVTILGKCVRANLDTTAGFVLDQAGGTLELLDWDDVVRGEPVLVTPVPELVALRLPVMDTHRELRGYPRRQLGELMAIGYPNYLEML